LIANCIRTKAIRFVQLHLSFLNFLLVNYLAGLVVVVVVVVAGGHGHGDGWVDGVERGRVGDAQAAGGGD